MIEYNNMCLCLDVCFCELIVLCIEEVILYMCCIVLGGDDLVGFDLFGVDDYIKLFFFNVVGEMVLLVLIVEGCSYLVGKEFLLLCDYILCWWDYEIGELVIDFVLYDQGVVGLWVECVQFGDMLVIGGLCGLFVVVDSYDVYVLIGDEIVLLVIVCWLDVLLDGVEVQVFIEVCDEVECQDLLQYENVCIYWLECNGFLVVSSMLLEDMLIDFEVLDGDVFYWIVIELCWVWMMCKFIEGYLGVLCDWICFIGYWKVYLDEIDGD